jgi:signal transduction histidine kinase
VTEISLDYQETEEGLLLVLQDNGVGILAEEKQKIFERGYGRNTGLGLFLVREILSITGITIRENGTEGEGARFEMLIPKGSYRFADMK